MTPSNAAAQLGDLDDEAAALTLGKMPADKRAKILKETENRRATRLKKRLQEIR
jgi:flagellar motility protein MotE (MotC chaperone)